MRCFEIYRNVVVSIILIILFSSFDKPDNKTFPMKLDQSRVMQASAFKDNGDYISALDIYRKLLRSVESKTRTPEQEITTNKLIFEMADCYRLSGLYHRAEPLYRRLIRREHSDPIVYLYFGNCLRNTGKIFEAEVAYRQYKDYKPDDYRWKYGIKTCRITKEWLDSPVSFSVKKNPSLSGIGDDYRPYIDKKNNLLYIAQSDRLLPDVVKVGQNRLFLDIYRYKNVGGRWVGKKKIRTISTPEHDEFSISMSKDADQIYFTRCKIVDNKNKGCRILYSELKEGEWDYGKELELLTENVTIKDPYPSLDEKVFYFESSMEGGVGGSDIWKIERKNDNTWGKPVCLDTTLNTDGNERSPVVSPEGNLFFSSDKRLGMGCYDIFRAVPEGDKWTINNIGYPLNSVENDVAIAFTRGESEGYIVTDRNTSLSNYEIYTFNSVEPSIKGVVKDSYTSDLLNEVDVELIQDNKPIDLFITGKLGFYYFDLEDNNDYVMRISKTGYLKAVIPLRKEGFKTTNTIDKNFQMFRTDTTNIIYNIYFKGKELDMKRSVEGISNLLYVLFANPEYKIEIKVFNNEHEKSKNIILTKYQAHSLQRYLAERGLSKDRVIVNGYGNVPVIANQRLSKMFDHKVRPGYELSPAYIRLLEPKYRRRAIAASKRVELMVVGEL